MAFGIRPLRFGIEMPSTFDLRLLRRVMTAVAAKPAAAAPPASSAVLPFLATSATFPAAFCAPLVTLSLTELAALLPFREAVERLREAVERDFEVERDFVERDFVEREPVEREPVLREVVLRPLRDPLEPERVLEVFLRLPVDAFERELELERFLLGLRVCVWAILTLLS